MNENRRPVAVAGSTRARTSRWPIARGRVQGKDNGQIARAVGLSSESVRKTCTHLRLPWCGYDLGSRVTIAHVKKIVDATGLGRRSFGRHFPIPKRLAVEIGDWAAAQRLKPDRAAAVIRVRDRIIADVFRANASGGARRWHVPSASGTLATLVPDLGRASRTLRELLSRSRSFLRQNPSATAEEWGEWLCAQAPAELAFLPLAAELAPHIERRFSALRARSPRLWELILADRFGVSRSVVHHAATAKPAEPEEIERFILSSAHGMAASATAAASKRPQRTPKRVEDRTEEEVYRMVEVELAGGSRRRREVIAARHRIADSTHRTYATVAEYHRRGLTRHQPRTPND